jgi:glutamyl-tRNA reductase
MTFYALGLNHERASVEKTEAFALDEDAQQAVYDNLILSEEAEVVLLSTCNRTEAYLYGRSADVRRVETALGRAAGRPWPEETAFRRKDEAAVRHVLQVTAGLKSMVLGDQQILAQMKAAYQRAVDAGQVHSLMHRLLHTAFRAAKRVSTETDLSRGAASVSTAAVEMARQYFSERVPPQLLSEIRVLLVGAGKMGQLALEALQEDAPASIEVTNRSPERAHRVAEAYEASVVPWQERHQVLPDVDLAVVATGAPEPVVGPKPLPPWTEADSPTLLVDIARPRNVDPSVDTRPEVDVYDLDDLQAWTDQVRDRRSAAVPDAEAICEDLLSDFVTWVFHQQALEPAIQAIRETFDSIRKQEVDRHAHRTDMDREEVEQLTKSIMQKLLAVPIVRLKNVDPDSIDFVQGIELLHALFAPTEEGGRSLQEAPPDEQPSLSEAPSRCPYLTHDPDASSNDGESLSDVLQMDEEAFTQEVSTQEASQARPSSTRAE